MAPSGHLPDAAPSVVKPSSMTIPAFDIHNTLPTVLPGSETDRHPRSPFRAGIVEFCMRFGTTPVRRSLLRGLLSLRADLRACGVDRGFQWADGSFVSDIEQLEKRPPSDIDVVSFIDARGITLGSAAGQALYDIADTTLAKPKYGIDHYVVELGHPMDRDATAMVAYWHSVWSHRRHTDRWKGFVEITLEGDDTDALTWLDSRETATAEDNNAAH